MQAFTQERAKRIITAINVARSLWVATQPIGSPHAHVLAALCNNDFWESAKIQFFSVTPTEPFGCSSFSSTDFNALFAHLFESQNLRYWLVEAQASPTTIGAILQIFRNQLSFVWGLNDFIRPVAIGRLCDMEKDLAELVDKDRELLEKSLPLHNLKEEEECDSEGYEAEREGVRQKLKELQQRLSISSVDDDDDEVDFDLGMLGNASHAKVYTDKDCWVQQIEFIIKVALKGGREGWACGHTVLVQELYWRGLRAHQDDPEHTSRHMDWLRPLYRPKEGTKEEQAKQWKNRSTWDLSKSFNNPTMSEVINLLGQQSIFSLHLFNNFTPKLGEKVTHPRFGGDRITQSTLLYALAHSTTALPVRAIDKGPKPMNLPFSPPNSQRATFVRSPLHAARANISDYAFLPWQLFALMISDYETAELSSHSILLQKRKSTTTSMLDKTKLVDGKDETVSLPDEKKKPIVAKITIRYLKNLWWPNQLADYMSPYSADHRSFSKEKDDLSDSNIPTALRGMPFARRLTVSTLREVLGRLLQASGSDKPGGAYGTGYTPANLNFYLRDATSDAHPLCGNALDKGDPESLKTRKTRFLNTVTAMLSMEPLHFWFSISQVYSIQETEGHDFGSFLVDEVRKLLKMKSENSKKWSNAAGASSPFNVQFLFYKRLAHMAAVDRVCLHTLYRAARQRNRRESTLRVGKAVEEELVLLEDDSHFEDSFSATCNSSASDVECPLGLLPHEVFLRCCDFLLGEFALPKNFLRDWKSL